MPGRPSPSCPSMSAWRRSTVRCWKPPAIWAMAPVRRFLRITLPLSMPGVIGAAILIFVPTTGDYVTPALVGGTQGTMIANLIEVQFNGVGNWPLGAALALVSMAMVGGDRGPVRGGGARRGERRRDEKAAGFSSMPSPIWPFSICRCCCCRSSPSTIPNSSPFRSPASPPAGMRRWPPTAPCCMRLGNSLKVGVVTALLSTMLGLTAARAVTRYRLRGAGAALGFISPAAVHSRHRAGHFAAVAAGRGRLSAVAGGGGAGTSADLRALRADRADRPLRRLRPQSGRSFSADLGEDDWMTFWRVTFPLMLPGIVASLLLTFITSFDEFPGAAWAPGRARCARAHGRSRRS